MKNLKIPTAVVAAFASSASADVTIGTAAPSGTSVIATSTAIGTTASKIFDIDANANHARGNRFIVPDGGGTTFRIDSVTIQSALAQTFLNDTFTLHIYQGTSAQWNEGEGRVAGEDIYIGTSVTPLVEETFTFSETVTNANYVTFTLTDPLIVDEDDHYGFFFTFDQVDGALDSFSYRESGSPADADDGRTSISATDHGTASARQVNYWVQGEAIDPGITDSTLVPTEDLITTGDSIDLAITFDTTVDTATLTTPTGSIDLLALDAGDDTPGDGIVTVTETLTTSFTYEIDVTKTGQTAENTSVDITVVDPSLVADNALSTAIKASSPLFYYRFEEAADTGYIIDYSGNGNHTADIVGTPVQGSTDGGIDNGIELNGDGGVRTPVSRVASNAYTFVGVIKPDVFPTTAFNTILSATDGGGGVIGRSLLYTNTNGLGSAIVNPITVADSSALSTETAYLVHMVSIPDPNGDSDTSDRELRIYLNGQLYATTPIGSVNTNNGTFILGGNKTLTDEFFSGFLDEAAVFAAALSDTEIEAQGDAYITLAEGTFFGFFADSTEITIGESTDLIILASDDATSVTLDGSPVTTTSGTGKYVIPVSPTETTTYNVVVEGPGGPYTSSVEVVVNAVVIQPIITSISVIPDEDAIEGQEPRPPVTMEVLGAPNTDYTLYGSSEFTLDFLVEEFTTDENGEATLQFEGFDVREFYRVEGE